MDEKKLSKEEIKSDNRTETNKINNKNNNNIDNNEIVIKNQKCPACGENSLTLIEKDLYIPHFGRTSIFSMSCNKCGYHKADIESLEKHEPITYEFTVKSPEDLNVKVIKSSNADVIFGRIGKIESTISSNGYITTIEGLINRMESMLNYLLKDENTKDKKKIKSHLKKIRRVKSGYETMVIKIKDRSGNSAILSDNAIKKPLKVKK